jgi:tetratricopeptide (TPR) repeat protein
MMTTRRVGFLLVLLLGASPVAARGAQDPLARAKDFYAAAAYEDALQVLTELGARKPAADVAAYRVYCLLALGRTDEAKATVEGLVRIDPTFHPSEADASPRVRAFFAQVRRPLLPDIVRQTYTRGKDAFYRKDMAEASAAFDRVVQLLDDLDVSENEELADLRTLAGGFRELSKAAPAPPPLMPAVSATPAQALAPVATAPVALRIYTANDEGISRPVALARVVPRWRPINATEERLELQGSIELLISEAGTVLSVAITKSIHPRYDPLLLAAAREWTFRPAIKDGVPVKYRYPFDVRIGGPAQ